jgi:predicted  nucleic acid-binding Zn-ribbon protein
MDLLIVIQNAKTYILIIVLIAILLLVLSTLIFKRTVRSSSDIRFEGERDSNQILMPEAGIGSTRDNTQLSIVKGTAEADLAVSRIVEENNTSSSAVIPSLTAFSYFGAFPSPPCLPSYVTTPLSLTFATTVSIAPVQALPDTVPAGISSTHDCIVTEALVKKLRDSILDKDSTIKRKESTLAGMRIRMKEQAKDLDEANRIAIVRANQVHVLTNLKLSPAVKKRPQDLGLIRLIEEPDKVDQILLQEILKMKEINEQHRKDADNWYQAYIGAWEQVKDWRRECDIVKRNFAETDAGKLRKDNEQLLQDLKRARSKPVKDSKTGTFKKIQELETSLRSSQVSKDELDIQVSGLKEQLHASQVGSDSLEESKKQVNVLKDQITSLEQYIAMEASLKREAITSLEALTTTHHEIVRVHETCSRKADADEEPKVKEMEGALAALKVRNADLDKDLQAAHEKLISYEQEATQYKMGYVAGIERELQMAQGLKQKLADAGSQLAESQTRYNALQANRVRETAQQSALAAEKESLALEVQGLQTQATMLRAQNEFQRRRILDMEVAPGPDLASENAVIKYQSDRLQAVIAKLQQEIVNLQGNSKSSASQVSALQREKATIQNELNISSSQIEQLKQEKSRMASQLEGERVEYERLKLCFGDEEAALKDAVETVKEAADENEALKAKLDLVQYRHRLLQGKSRRWKLHTLTPKTLSEILGLRLMNSRRRSKN